MRNFFLIFLLIGVSSSAQAGGCPPWLPCGKKFNLIIADDSYSSTVSSAMAAAAASASVMDPTPDASEDIELRITAAAAQSSVLNGRLQLNPRANPELAPMDFVAEFGVTDVRIAAAAVKAAVLNSNLRPSQSPSEEGKPQD